MFPHRRLIVSFAALLLVGSSAATAEAKRFRGVIAQVGSNQIALTTQQIIGVDLATTKIRLNGAKATIGDLQTGDTVLVTAVSVGPRWQAMRITASRNSAPQRNNPRGEMRDPLSLEFPAE